MMIHVLNEKIDEYDYKKKSDKNQRQENPALYLSSVLFYEVYDPFTSLYSGLVKPFEC